MNSLRQSMSIAKVAYRNWLLNIRQLFSFLIMAYFLFKCISPIMLTAEYYNMSLSFGEYWISEMNETITFTILVYLFIFVISDVPNIGGLDYFIFIRCSKKIWVLGQAIFALLAAVTYMAAIGIVDIVFSIGKTAFSQNWSEFFQSFYESGAEKMCGSLGAICYITPQTMNHFPLIPAFLHTAVLTLLLLIFVCIFIALFNLINKKILGIVFCGVLITLGAISNFIGSGIKWLFPLSHAMLSAHNGLVTKDMPVINSYFYFIVIDIVLIGVMLMLSKYLKISASNNE